MYAYLYMYAEIYTHYGCTHNIHVPSYRCMYKLTHTLEIRKRERGALASCQEVKRDAPPDGL